MLGTIIEQESSTTTWERGEVRKLTTYENSEKHTQNTPETYLGSMWQVKSKKIFTNIYSSLPIYQLSCSKVCLALLQFGGLRAPQAHRDNGRRLDNEGILYRATHFTGFPIFMSVVLNIVYPPQAYKITSLTPPTSQGQPHPQSETQKSHY